MQIKVLTVEVFTETKSPKRNSSGSENGGYLLSHKCSTIGDVELNDPVRNGKGWDLNAITTLIMF